METSGHNADFIVPAMSSTMITEEILIKRRQHMVRSLREAGISFDEIVTILRIGSQCAEKAGLRNNLSANVRDGDGQCEAETL